MSDNVTSAIKFTSPQGSLTPWDLVVQYYPYIIGTLGAALAIYGVWDRWFPKVVANSSDAYIDHSSCRRFESHKYTFQWGNFFKRVKLPKFPRHANIEVLSYKPHPSYKKEIPDGKYKVIQEKDYCQVTLLDIPFFKKVETEYVHVLVSAPIDTGFKEKIHFIKDATQITITNENYDTIHNYKFEIEDDVAFRNMLILLDLQAEVSRPNPTAENQNAIVTINIPCKELNGNLPGKLTIKLN